jgi:hypothetical protein
MLGPHTQITIKEGYTSVIRDEKVLLITDEMKNGINRGLRTKIKHETPDPTGVHWEQVCFRGSAGCSCSPLLLVGGGQPRWGYEKV